MRKNTIITIAFCLGSFISYGNEMNTNEPSISLDTLPTTQLVTFLQQMNVESFYGKPVDSFIHAIDATPYNMRVYGGSHSKWLSLRASYLWYQYSGGPIIRVYVREYTHMNRYSPAGTWDINLFRKEKVYKIEVYKNQNICINGGCMN